MALLSVIAWTLVHVQALSEPLAKGLTAPIFVPPDPHPAAVLTIGSISREYARHGYFRIGALPELVIDSVTLEIRNPSVIGRILDALNERSLPHLPDKWVRIRNVCLKAGYGSRSIIVAAEIRKLGRLRWRFVDGVVSNDGTNFHTFDEASLSVSGPGFGQLVVMSSLKTNLIPFLQNPAPSYPGFPKE